MNLTETLPTPLLRVLAPDVTRRLGMIVAGLLAVVGRRFLREPRLLARSRQAGAEHPERAERAATTAGGRSPQRIAALRCYPPGLAAERLGRTQLKGVTPPHVPFRDLFPGWREKSLDFLRHW
jgi:hypothetical protein